MRGLPSMLARVLVLVLVPVLVLGRYTAGSQGSSERRAELLG